MPANAYLKSITLGLPTWTRLADAPTVLQATIIADTKNANPIMLRVGGGVEAAWPPGAAASFESVDLSEVEVQGDSGHRVFVAGYTPGDRPHGRGALRLLAKMPVYLAQAEPGGEVPGGGIG